MGYIGRGLNTGQYSKLDSIAGSFDGSVTTFSLEQNGTAVTPSAQNCLISLGGVIQEPFVAFSVTGSILNFSEAPATDDTFFGIVMGEAAFIAGNTVGQNELQAPSSIASYIGNEITGSLGANASLIRSLTAAAISGSVVGGVSGSAASTGSFGDVALRKGGKVKFSDASYIALSGSSISAPGEGIDMVANNLLALNIDETGAVTKPLQPAFSVSKTSLADSLTSTDSIFENGITEHFDNNGDFTSGVFTAPVTGKYHFTCRSIWESVSEGTSIDIILYGSNRNFWCSNRSMYHDDATGHGGYWSIGGSCVLDMDANDTADMQISGAGTCHNNGEIFYMQGYLLG